MGWRSDWLYKCIFEQVELVWKEMQKETRDPDAWMKPGRGDPFKTMSECLIVEQCEQVDREKTDCRAPVKRSWKYDGTNLRVLTPPEIEALFQDRPQKLKAERRMLYDVGWVQFYISERRDFVVFTYQVGPRYGRGKWFAVTGQGAKGKLWFRGYGWIS